MLSNIKTLKEILGSSVQLNEMIVADTQSNKYVVKDSQTATINLYKKGKTGSTMIIEKTLVVYNFDNNQLFLIVFEDIPENYESGISQSQLKQIFDSFRFIC